jgi:multidrug efflux pump subunit AcrA (membrane-fusion protein)
MLIVAVGVLTAAVGSFAALHGLHRSGHTPSSSLATATAVRGDILSTVGGLGRVVVARQSTQVTVPTGTSGSASSSSSPATSPGGQSAAPPGAVFATSVGHIAQYLVSPGQRVAAGQPIALLDDGGTTATAMQQARSDLASARLELAQKQLSDPAKGLPPTPAELSAARFAITAARERLGQLVHPTRADVLTARLDIHKGMADLATLTRNPPSAAMTAAQSAIDAAAQKLAQISGPPTPAEVTAVKLELAKAQADLDALRAAPPAVSATAVAAAQLAVTLAQRKLVDLPTTATQSEKLQAQLDVAKAQADLDALQKQAPAASASAIAAAQTAVDLATQKLAQLTGPPNPTAVATTQAELKKAQADLATLLRKPLPAAVDASNLAIALAKQKLTQVLHPTRAARDTIRLDIANAHAALVTLQRRGGPANPNDIGIARLKVDAAAAKLALADSQAARLTVHAPVAGTVTALLGSLGSPTDVTTPVATVADLQHLAVSVDLSEFDVARVRQGLPALVSVDALGGKHLPGTVEFTALTGVDNGGVVTFPVRVAMRAAAGVKPGMNVSVKIITRERRNVVTVPLEAVQHDAGHATVTVVGRNGKTATRVVRLGLADNKTIEVMNGLQPGERVQIGSGQSGP